MIEMRECDRGRQGGRRKGVDMRKEQINKGDGSEGWGALTLEGGTGMCRGHDPLFSGQLALPGLPICHQCAALMPPFSIFRKMLHFQPCFSSKFQLSRHEFSFPRPLIFQAKSAP